MYEWIRKNHSRLRGRGAWEWQRHARLHLRRVYVGSFRLRLRDWRIWDRRLSPRAASIRPLLPIRRRVRRSRPR